MIHDGAPTSSDLWSTRWMDDSLSDRGAIKASSYQVQLAIRLVMIGSVMIALTHGERELWKSSPAG